MALFVCKDKTAQDDANSHAGGKEEQDADL
jgi:hypothetical protein